MTKENMTKNIIKEKISEMMKYHNKHGHNDKFNKMRAEIEELKQKQAKK